MKLLAAVLIALPLLSSAVLPLGWPTGSVKRRFFDTPKGQLHYVVGGDVRSGVPLFFIHSHPRSSVEFRYLVDDLEHTSFLAIDWFGMGMSDDYKGADASDTFCTFEEMAQYLRKIADVEHVKKFVPVGNLKGANPAIELAYQAGSSRVQHIVLMNPLILSPKAKAFMNDVYEPMLRNQALSVNGSHLIAAWMDPSAAAMGPDGAPWSNSRDLLSNQEKTNDELRCLSTGWQYGAAWVAYNEQNEPRMATVDSYAKSLLLYGTQSLADLEKYGLDPQFSDESFAKALSHGRNSTIYVHGGSQGMVIQNSSMIASKVAEFIKSKAAQVVV